MNRLHLVLSGRVQGVGFRWFVRGHAESLGLAGRVWNRDDGAVEVEAEGAREALERLVEAVRQGPRAARVEHVAVEWSHGPSRHRRFEIGAPAGGTES